MAIQYTPEHYVAAIAHRYPVPLTYDLLVESIANSPSTGRGMDRALCQELRSAGIPDEKIALLLQHSPHIAYQRRADKALSDVIVEKYIQMILLKK
jgi:hypothetical protein